MEADRGNTVPRMDPLATLQLWFAKFAEDPGSARELWSEGATLHAPDGGFTGGFDDLLSWYAHRRENEGPGFNWHVEELLGGERYAVAIIRLVSDNRPDGWEQHAVYQFHEGTIREVWLHESGARA